MVDTVARGLQKKKKLNQKKLSQVVLPTLSTVMTPIMSPLKSDGPEFILPHIVLAAVASAPRKANKFKKQLGLEARPLGDSQQMLNQRLNLPLRLIMDTMARVTGTTVMVETGTKLETLMDTETVSLVKKKLL